MGLSGISLVTYQELNEMILSVVATNAQSVATNGFEALEITSGLFEGTIECKACRIKRCVALRWAVTPSGIVVSKMELEHNGPSVDENGVL